MNKTRLESLALLLLFDKIDSYIVLNVKDFIAVWVSLP